MLAGSREVDRGLKGQMLFQVCHKYALGNGNVGVDGAEMLDLSSRLVPDSTTITDRSWIKEHKAALLILFRLLK